MREVNYDESLVPDYELPDLLKMADGTAVTDAAMWRDQRRPELLALFARKVYGKTMPAPEPMRFEIIDEDRQALEGRAVRKQVIITVSNNGRELPINLLIYLPADAVGPVPAFIGPNFNGNHRIYPDPAIRLPEGWMREGEGVVDNCATDAGRGLSAERWCVENTIKRGYGIATIYYGDLDPDYDDGFQNGVHPLFYKDGQTRPADDEWGAIGAWAWGLSRGLDYLETDPDVDAGRVIAIGHSRLGKTALWAGAQDERFAGVISNNSGCGGSALSRRCFGETIARINETFPHWFCGNFKQYNDREEDLPLDQHMLIALCAPRPVYIASATEDQWADPKGEFLSALHAGPVFELLGESGLPADAMPDPDQPVAGHISYHLRTGKHGVTEWDWNNYLDFMEKRVESRG